MNPAELLRDSMQAMSEVAKLKRTQQGLSEDINELRSSLNPAKCCWSVIAKSLSVNIGLGYDYDFNTATSLVSIIKPSVAITQLFSARVVLHHFTSTHIVPLSHHPKRGGQVIGRERIPLWSRTVAPVSLTCSRRVMRDSCYPVKETFNYCALCFRICDLAVKYASPHLFSLDEIQMKSILMIWLKYMKCKLLSC